MSIASKETERKAEHSSLPWGAAEQNCPEDCHSCGIYESDEGQLVIADLNCDIDGGKAAARANAEFIVRACNSHYDLLAALKALLGDMDSGLLVRDTSRDHEPGWAIKMLPFVQRIKAAQNAVAKAEGKE